MNSSPIVLTEKKQGDIRNPIVFFRRVAQPEERYPDTVEVVSSSLTAPTSKINKLQFRPDFIFSFCYHFATTFLKYKI